MFRVIRKIAVFLLAVSVSFGLLISIPMLQHWLKHGNTEKQYTKTQVALTKQLQPDQKLKQLETRHQPKRSTPTDRNIKAGPRFAMDLGVAGGSAGGATISNSLLRPPGGGGSEDGVVNGDVDEKPSMRGAPAFQAPQSIRESETDAMLRLSFCVDANGRPYDIRVIEETPAGKGLADAGRQALNQASFAPARKGGNAVPFCGLELPFEVKFRD